MIFVNVDTPLDESSSKFVNVLYIQIDELTLPYKKKDSNSKFHGPKVVSHDMIVMMFKRRNFVLLTFFPC